MLTLNKYLTVLLIILNAAFANAQDHRADYARWEIYSIDNCLKYPDFNLCYKGTKQGALYPGESSESTRRMGEKYYFVAESGNEKVDVIWSEGTGDIGPTFFTLANKTYVLEMVFSDILTKRAPKNSVAIWLKTEWKSEKERHWFWKIFW